MAEEQHKPFMQARSRRRRLIALACSIVVVMLIGAFWFWRAHDGADAADGPDYMQQCTAIRGWCIPNNETCFGPFEAKIIDSLNRTLNASCSRYDAYPSDARASCQPAMHCCVMTTVIQ